MNILFTICGRAGSKGIKNKNIRDFCGAPLPLYTLAAMSLYKNNTENHVDIVLNTDSEELITIFDNNNICKVDVIRRKPELATDTVAKIDVIRNCYEEMCKSYNTDYDMVVDLDITAPLRTAEDIEKLVEEKRDTDYDVVFSVTDSRRNPYFNMVVKTNNGYERVIKSSFNTRQEAPEIFDMNASMYAYSPSFLKENKNIFDGRCGVIKMYDTAVLDLDHENDFVMMEIIADHLFKRKDLKFQEIKEHVETKENEYLT